MLTLPLSREITFAPIAEGGGFRSRAPQKNTLGAGYGQGQQVPRGSLARQRESRLVAGPVGHSGPSPQFKKVRSDGRGVRLRQGVQEPRSERGHQGFAR